MKGEKEKKKKVKKDRKKERKRRRNENAPEEVPSKWPRVRSTQRYKAVLERLISTFVNDRCRLQS